MLIPDINVLLYAHFADFPGHEAARRWITAADEGQEIVATPDLVLTGYIRIATNASLFATPVTIEQAVAVAGRFHTAPNRRRLVTGPRHWAVFTQLVLAAGIGSKDVTDAYLAAFAIENDATFVTFDRGFARFPGLKVLVPH